MTDVNDNGQNPNGTSSDNASNNNGSNSNNAGGGDGQNKDKGDDKGNNPTDKKGDPNQVPSWRLKEEADARRAAEAKLKEYQDKEAQEEEKKKKAQGKYEELITEKDGKIKEYETKVATIPTYEAKITAMVDNALAWVKTAIGEEKLNKILGIVGFDSLDVLGKADSLEKIASLVAEIAPANNGNNQSAKGGAGIDPNKDKSIDEAAKGWFNSFLSAMLWGASK